MSWSVWWVSHIDCCVHLVSRLGQRSDMGTSVCSWPEVADDASRRLYSTWPVWLTVLKSRVLYGLIPWWMWIVKEVVVETFERGIGCKGWIYIIIGGGGCIWVRSRNDMRWCTLGSTDGEKQTATSGTIMSDQQKKKEKGGRNKIDHGNYLLLHELLYGLCIWFGAVTRVVCSDTLMWGCVMNGGGGDRGGAGEREGEKRWKRNNVRMCDERGRRRQRRNRRKGRGEEVEEE